MAFGIGPKSDRETLIEDFKLLFDYQLNEREAQIVHNMQKGRDDQRVIERSLEEVGQNFLRCMRIARSQMRIEREVIPEY